MGIQTGKLLLEKPTVGADANVWGGFLNSNADILDLAVQVGEVTKTVTGGALTLTAAESANSVLVFTGTLTSNQTVAISGPARNYTVVNGTTGAFSLTVAGVVVPVGAFAVVWNGVTGVLATAGSVADAAITTAKLADNAVTSAKILDGTIATADLANNAVTQAKLGTDVLSRIGSQGAISGDRNRVINGSCQIVNVPTFVASNNTAGYGGPELFAVTNSGAGGQFTQSQASLTFNGIVLPTVRQTVNTAIVSTATTNYWHGIYYLIEGFNVFDLRTKPVALSFVFNTNVTGTYSVAVRDGNSSQSYVTTISATANTPTQVSIPIAAIPSAANVPNTNATGLLINIGAVNTGVFQTATLNAWQTAGVFTAAGATNWGATAGNFIELTSLQLEEGTVATEFVRRSYGQELLLTQRYAEYVEFFRCSGFYVPAINAFQTQAIPFKVVKRVTPTTTITAGTIYWADGANVFSATSNAGANFVPSTATIQLLQTRQAGGAQPGDHFSYHIEPQVFVLCSARL